MMQLEPITRAEQIMSGQDLIPITREEMFLAKAAGRDVETPTPITRRELFLSQISGGYGGSAELTHTVRFYNEDVLLQTVTVKHGESVAYTGDTPVCIEDPSWEFTGFAPSPTNVTADMDCYAQYKAEIDLASTSWANISKISADGTGANYFSVGDTKPVTLKGTMGTIELNDTYLVFILGFNHNSEIEGTGIHFGGFKYASGDGHDICLVDSKHSANCADGTPYFNMNHFGNYNFGGWSGSDMRYDILGSTDVAPSNYGAVKTSGVTGNNPTSECATNPVANTLMACLPVDLRAVMKPITKWTDNVGDAGDTEDKVTASVDYLPLLAEFEIFGVRKNANSYEKNHQQQYAYYGAGAKTGRDRHSDGGAAFWFTRSIRPSNRYFCTVYSSGTSDYRNADHSYGIAPVFMV